MRSSSWLFALIICYIVACSCGVLLYCWFEFILSSIYEHLTGFGY